MTVTVYIERQLLLRDRHGKKHLLRQRLSSEFAALHSTQKGGCGAGEEAPVATNVLGQLGLCEYREAKSEEVSRPGS